MIKPTPSLSSHGCFYGLRLVAGLLSLIPLFSCAEAFKAPFVAQAYECDGLMHSPWGVYDGVPIKIIVHGGMKEGESLSWSWGEYDEESNTYTMGAFTHHDFGHKNAQGQIIERKSDIILSYYWNAPGTINLEKCEFVWEVEQGALDGLKQLVPFF